MGFSASKPVKQIENTVDTQEENKHPISVLSKDVEFNKLDPRSPSTYISRTPLQSLTVADRQFENEHVQCDKLNETPIEQKCLVLGIDPRSPTIEFQRTPIVINNYSIPKKNFNKNLENVILSEIKTPQCKTNKLTSSVKVTPPKLLESTPLQPKTDLHKRKSFVGLLETNIDFTETDIDLAFQEKCKSHSDISILRNRIHAVKSENVDPRSPTTDFVRTPIQIFKKIGEIELNDVEQIDSLVDEQEAKMKNIVSSNLEFQFKEEKVYEACFENKNSEMCQVEKILPDSESLEVVSKLITQNAIDSNSVKLTDKKKIIKQTELSSITNPPVDLTADIQELNKKLTDLIYEDEDIVVCPKIVKLREYNERSPLRNRNIIEVKQKKSKPLLKVKDKPRKNECLVSKIPIYQEKNIKTHIQCENTPPRKIIESKQSNKKPCLWDNADKTLYL